MVALTVQAEAVAAAYERFAAGLLSHERVPLDPIPADPGGWPADLGLDLYHLADLRVWLGRLADDLARIAAPPRAAAPIYAG